MIPKVRIPEIAEFLSAIIAEACTSDSTSMKVFIPVLMLDGSISNIPRPISVNNTIFVSKETIQVSSLVTGQDYLTVGVSPLIKLLPSRTYSVGSKVRIYVPNLDLHQAIVVPL